VTQLILFTNRKIVVNSNGYIIYRRRTLKKIFILVLFTIALGECDYALGDINQDGGWNVLDIVALANCVVGQNCADFGNGCAGDLNGDGDWNVFPVR